MLMPGISDPSRVKFNLNATYYTKLTGNLSWNVSVYDNWDNQPPTGLSGSDDGASSGPSWTFGNKWPRFGVPTTELSRATASSRHLITPKGLFDDLRG